MSNKNEYHMNIGGASIILLLIVFALTIFAALSVRASYHEMKLASKTRESVESYYELDTEAEHVCAAVSCEYYLHILDGGSADDFVYDGVTVENGLVKYSVVNSNDKMLSVSLILEDDGSVTVKTWRLEEYEYGEYESGSDTEDGFGDIIIID